MVSVKKIVMVTLVAVTKFKVGAVFWLELQAIINR